MFRLTGRQESEVDSGAPDGIVTADASVPGESSCFGTGEAGGRRPEGAARPRTAGVEHRPRDPMAEIEGQIF